MIDLNRSSVPLPYEVTVGFSSVQVTGRNREEAIEEARRELGRQLPRLYDVIRGLADNRFRVEPRSVPSSAVIRVVPEP